jgi:hypothetical protein
MSKIIINRSKTVILFFLKSTGYELLKYADFCNYNNIVVYKNYALKLKITNQLMKTMKYNT